MYQGFINWLPLLVSLVAGIFALTQIRSNNITNARIKWLENFKHVFTEFLSECSTLLLKEGIAKGIISKATTNKIPESTSTYLNDINTSIVDHLKIIESKYNLIKLSLNPGEDLHQKLEGLLENYMDLMNEITFQKTINDFNRLISKMNAISDTIVFLIRYILKLEWEKLKRPYLLRKWYMKRGSGKTLLSEAMNLKLLPERKVEKPN